MSGEKRDEDKFLDTLSHDLASQALEDEEVCEEALKSDVGDVDGAVGRIQEAAARAVAEQRRVRMPLAE